MGGCCLSVYLSVCKCIFVSVFLYVCVSMTLFVSMNRWRSMGVSVYQRMSGPSI